MEKKQVFYKSDVQVILACDAGWTQPFKLRFYSASPSRYHLASYDGETYVGCHLTNDGRLCVSIDNTDENGKSKLGVGTLMVEPEIILDNDCFGDGACNEKVKATPVVCVATNGTEYNVVLDLNGSSTLELIGTLPPYWQKGITDEEYQAVLDATEDANDAVDDANAAIALCQVAATSAGSAATQATQAASNAERAKGNVDVALSQLATFTQNAQAVVAGASNVNASLNGVILTVTDKTGATRQQNVLGPKGDKGDQGPAVPIVDNLTTSDGTKALSAKQGKALKDSADLLEQSVNGELERIQQYVGDIETLGTGEGSIVECIENDRGYISQLVAGKVDNTDIADNLTTNDSTKVLSAKQGRNLALDQATIRQDIQRIYDDEIGDTDISEIGDTITEAIYNENEKLSELEGQSLSVKEVKTNGNIVLKDGNGNEKEYMSATPSGCPLHELFLICGAVWNATSGYWEKDGLTDLTNSDMINAFYQSTNIELCQSGAKGYDARILLIPLHDSMYKEMNSINLNYWFYYEYGKIPKLEVMTYPTFDGYFKPSSFSRAFWGQNKLKTITNVITFSVVSDISSCFEYCYKLENVKIKGLNKNISFKDCKVLSNNSIKYIVKYAGSATITITLHADAYARAMADADVQSALATKTNVTLVSA